MRSKLDGNPTLFHPCPRKKPTTKQMTLYTLQTIAASLVVGVKLRNTNEESTRPGRAKFVLGYEEKQAARTTS